MRTPPANVNPDVLRWARECSGASVAELAAALDQPEERVRAWETGEDRPSFAQLRLLSAKLKRPTAAFFLPEPPTRSRQRPADFRSLPAQETLGFSASLDLEIRLARLKRDDALGLAADLEIEVPQFSLTSDRGRSPEELGRRFRAWCGVPNPGHPVWRDKYTALKAWRDAIEKQGVLVMQISGISVAEMRGCALAEFPLPVILVNAADAPAARTFTLLHELTHLSLGQNGLCDLSESNPFSSRETEALEIFCNQVAGSALVPMDALVATDAVRDHRRAGGDSAWSGAELVALSRQFGTSQEVVLRRLLTAGLTDNDFYNSWRADNARQQLSVAEPGFVEVFRKVLNHNGRVFTSLVLDAYRKEVLTGSEVSRKLGTKLNHVPQIEAEIARWSVSS